MPSNRTIKKIAPLRKISRDCHIPWKRNETMWAGDVRFVETDRITGEDGEGKAG